MVIFKLRKVIIAYEERVFEKLIRTGFKKN